MFDFFGSIFDTNNIYSRVYVEQEALDKLLAGKSKKQIHNILRVLYGKKKDRGHIKEKYQKLCKEQRDIHNTVMNIFRQAAIHRGMI